MKRLTLNLVVVLVAVSLLGACGAKKNDTPNAKKGDWKKIEESGKLVIGVDDTFVPMGFRDEKNELVGFDIDFAEAVVAELGLEAEFQPIEWSMKETELSNGSIDVIWNGYTVTEERKKKVDFTQPYLKNEQVVVTLKKSNITKYADLQDKVIGAQEGSSGAAKLTENPELILDLVKDNEAVLYPTFVEAFLDVNNGRIDGFIIDKVFAEYYISKEDDPDKYLILPSLFEEEDFAVGVRKGASDTLEKINDAMTNLAKDGKAQEISEKWFDEDRVVTK